VAHVGQWAPAVTGSAGRAVTGATMAWQEHMPIATGARGQSGFWAAGPWPSPISKFSNIPNHT
jgi:hypothetical protein